MPANRQDSQAEKQHLGPFEKRSYGTVPHDEEEKKVSWFTAKQTLARKERVPKSGLSGVPSENAHSLRRRHHRKNVMHKVDSGYLADEETKMEDDKTAANKSVMNNWRIKEGLGSEKGMANVDSGNKTLETPQESPRPLLRHRAASLNVQFEWPERERAPFLRGRSTSVTIDPSQVMPWNDAGRGIGGALSPTINTGRVFFRSGSITGSLHDEDQKPVDEASTGDEMSPRSLRSASVEHNPEHFGEHGSSELEHGGHHMRHRTKVTMRDLTEEQISSREEKVLHDVFKTLTRLREPSNVAEEHAGSEKPFRGIAKG